MSDPRTGPARSHPPARSTWQAGDFRRMAVGTLVVAEMLCDAVPVRAGTDVLDVAAGTGNVTLAAARRRARAVGVDVVPELLEAARQRAEFEGLTVDLRAGEMEHLPFGDASFDSVLSTFGVMFSGDPERAASELVRVTRPGGRIGLASWTPESFYGRFFALLRSHAPSTPGIGAPERWGTREGIERLLGPFVHRLAFQDRQILVRSDSADAFANFLPRFFGPMVTVLGALSESEQRRLRTQVLELIQSGQRSPGPDLLLPVAYLEVVADRGGEAKPATPRRSAPDA